MNMEMAIANVCRVDLLPEGGTPLHTVTAAEAGCTARLSEGVETPLRSKNRLLALSATEDIVLGYDLLLKELTVDPDAFALMDGGAVAWNGESGFTYQGPQTGQAVSRRPFVCDVWTEEKDGDGATRGYHRFRFPGCKGSPVSFAHKDGGFFAPEYRVKSRPALGVAPVRIDRFRALPALDATLDELLAYEGGREA